MLGTVITFSIPKASSNQTLGQNILFVDTSWVKPPVNNLEGQEQAWTLCPWVKVERVHTCGFQHLFTVPKKNLATLKMD